MKAVIVTGGKQYTVAEGDVIFVEKLGVEADQAVKFDQVLVFTSTPPNRSKVQTV